MDQESSNPYQSPNAPNGPTALEPHAVENEELSTVDWLVVIFCSGIGCIIGILRLIQGKPSAGKMIRMSLLFVFIWFVVRVVLTLLEAAARQG
jgi:hypothetical protein